MRTNRILTVFLAGLGVGLPATAAPDYQADVAPLLTQHCQKCHNATERKGGLVLSSVAGMLDGGDSGTAAIVPGDAAASELLRRVLSTDPKEHMPPDETLPPAAIETLTAWVQAGAPGGDGEGGRVAVQSEHWAFQPLTKSAPPEIADKTVQHPIDRFVRAKLADAGLEPAPQADKYTLIRRLHLDLLGLPPDAESVRDFVTDTAPDAYARLVERLLASPHFGERQAIWWLDAARYADTNGYEKDRYRSIWPYRDWVINAFNRDLSYDRFVVEQLAGDLLPQATVEQRVATGFLRNSMLNEEGGVDVEEFRYKEVVDRANTVGTAMLGLTLNCAQCHTHKFDPITQKEYFAFYAFLNNTDNVDLKLPDPAVDTARADTEARIAAEVEGLPKWFPLPDEAMQWTALPVLEWVSASGRAMQTAEDYSVVVTPGAADERDVYTLTVDVPAGRLDALELRVVPDPATGLGPGLAPNGNFVLSEITIYDASGEWRPRDEPLPLGRVTASHAQAGFEAAHATDMKPDTGWAIGGADATAQREQSLRLELAEPRVLEQPRKLLVKLSQQHGEMHLLGRFRISAGALDPALSAVPEETRRLAHYDAAFTAWKAFTAAKAQAWKAARPTACASKNLASFRVLTDDSVLVYGNIPNVDRYEIMLHVNAPEIGAIRLEALPDPSLPGGGPGRGVIMAEGDFLLSEIAVEAAPWDAPESLAPVSLTTPSHSYASANRSAAGTLDGQLDTGWSILGREGEAHSVVYNLGTPLRNPNGHVLKIVLDQYYVHQHTLGRFRISTCAPSATVESAGVPAPLEDLFLKPAAQWSEEEAREVERWYRLHEPQLEEARTGLRALRAEQAKYDATLVVAEREERRITTMYHRGEFLQPRGAVKPGVPAVLPPLAENAPQNRLGLARWIASTENPLTARVLVNRIWQLYFGQGLVTTPEDFGVRGATPSHPEMLDWLALEFMRQGWSIKELTRLIVTSETYKQDTAALPATLEKDPRNALLARGPRFRLDAEFIRDAALSAGGLLNAEIGGESVRPPLPPGLMSLAYGNAGWKDSTGPEKYRRGLYTYWKRMLPYPSATVFDAPARDTVCVARNRSTTPLQALTLLNDGVFMEASQAMACRVLKEADAGFDARLAHAFLLALARAPFPEERAILNEFYEKQKGRLALGVMPKNLAEPVAPELVEPLKGVDQDEVVLWTLLCRAILNLDEAITKT
ncbi:MAG: PSD1 domain-containing protein [Candidatus Hydrogenedentes bacterium]|nr:PSD1 domain-containing protein [Candidatus Hydrogenedentota bacterium]